jgi:hypothetical protein
MEKKKNGPQKGAAKKWSQRLKELGEQSPPKDLLEILNQTEKSKKISAAPNSDIELDV